MSCFRPHESPLEQFPLVFHRSQSCFRSHFLCLRCLFVWLVLLLRLLAGMSFCSMSCTQQADTIFNFSRQGLSEGGLHQKMFGVKAPFKPSWKPFLNPLGQKLPNRFGFHFYAVNMTFGLNLTSKLKGVCSEPPLKPMWGGLKPPWTKMEVDENKFLRGVNPFFNVFGFGPNFLKNLSGGWEKKPLFSPQGGSVSDPPWNSRRHFSAIHEKNWNKGGFGPNPIGTTLPSNLATSLFFVSFRCCPFETKLGSVSNVMRILELVVCFVGSGRFRPRPRPPFPGPPCPRPSKNLRQHQGLREAQRNKEIGEKPRICTPRTRPESKTSGGRRRKSSRMSMRTWRKCANVTSTSKCWEVSSIASDDLARRLQCEASSVWVAGGSRQGQSVRSREADWRWRVR